LKRHDFGLKIEENLKEYLICHIKFDKEDAISWILKQHLIHDFKTKFGEISTYQKTIRVIRFVLNTRDTCLKLKPKMDDENWDLVVYSDIYWPGNVENQICVT
jgi:hypothetical protein